MICKINSTHCKKRLVVRFCMKIFVDDFQTSTLGLLVRKNMVFDLKVLSGPFWSEVIEESFSIYKKCFKKNSVNYLIVLSEK